MARQFITILTLSTALVLLFQNCSGSFSGSTSNKNNSGALIFTALACPGGTLAGDVIITENNSIAMDCAIAGNLTVTNGATLQIDYSSSSNSVFVIRGDVTVDSTSKLIVFGHIGGGDKFVISNNFSQQRGFTASDNATISFKNIEFQTQENISASSSSLVMDFQGLGNSRLILENCNLNTSTAWLLGHFNNNASLTIIDSQGLPTENYIHDSATVKISGPSTHTGVWLDAEGAVGTISLPDQNSPYTWKIGRNNGLNVGWLFENSNASTGIGVEVRTGTSLEIIGHGTSAPLTGELKIGYFVENATENLVGLDVGIQNKIISPRLKLTDVQMGPIAWQIYPGAGSTVNIINSKINEIGISGQNSIVTVTNSILQLAVLAAMAPGSQLNITNSQIWNQMIQAANGGQVQITSSPIYGTLFFSSSASSTIAIYNSSFNNNPTGCTQSNMINISTGQPQCNPFRPSGAPAKMGPGQVTCTLTSGCSF